MKEKFVESEVLAWAFQNHWSLDVYDSKGVYSESRGGYRSSNLIKAGTSDLVGCDNQGHAVFVELKKPNHHDVCSLGQRQFLERKINCGAFGCVVSSAKQLSEIYSQWKSLPELERKEFLLSLLPRKVLVNKKIMHL